MPRSQTLVSAIIENLPDPVVIVDRSGTVIIANARARAVIRLAAGQDVLECTENVPEVRGFLSLCFSTTTPLPARVRFANGYENIVIGNRLSVPGMRLDGAVMLRFDDRLGLASRFAALNNDLSAMAEKIRQADQEKTELTNQALTDPLTKVFNRRGFELEFEKEISRSMRYGRPFCLALFDLDNFKTINDTFGHKLGDEVLCHFADRCLEHIRDADVFSRIGGEEFGLILPETSLKEAIVAVRRMLSIVNAIPLFSHGHRFAYTASAGLSMAIEGDTPDTLFKRTDALLYRAKTGGKAHVAVDGDPPASSGGIGSAQPLNPT